jgi:tRNA (mo5U34)-methyltransferase
MTGNDHIHKQIANLAPWFHNIHLPGGEETAPDHFLGDFPAFKWNEIKADIPQNLSGKTVLDVGCNAGFYALKLAQRGAQVTAIDLDTHYLKQAEWIIRQFGLEEKITLNQQQVYDLAHEDEQYDIVWFMGVFYHLRYPALGLDIISRKVRETMVFQTLTMPGCSRLETEQDYGIHDRKEMLKEAWPKMAFIEKEFSGDPTNWWFANRSGIEALLRSSGFHISAAPGNELYICKPDPQSPGVSRTWNESEYLSAIGRDWEGSYRKKTE